MGRQAPTAVAGPQTALSFTLCFSLHAPFGLFCAAMQLKYCLVFAGHAKAELALAAARAQPSPCCRAPPLDPNDYCLSHPSKKITLLAPPVIAVSSRRQHPAGKGGLRWLLLRWLLLRWLLLRWLRRRCHPRALEAPQRRRSGSRLAAPAPAAAAAARKVGRRARPHCAARRGCSAGAPAAAPAPSSSAQEAQPSPPRPRPSRPCPL